MHNFDEHFKNFTPDGSSLAAIFANRQNLEKLGVDPDNEDDTVFGTKFIYCAAHARSHSTGWCTVRLALKRPLAADTSEGARTEVATLGYPTV